MELEPSCTMEYNMFSCPFTRSAAEVFGITSLSEGAEAMEPFPHYSTQRWELFLFQIKSQDQAKNLPSVRPWAGGLSVPAEPGRSPRGTCWALLVGLLHKPCTRPRQWARNKQKYHIQLRKEQCVCQ